MSSMDALLLNIMSNRGKAYENKIFKLCQQRDCIFPGTTNAGGGSGVDICLKHNNKQLNIECKSAGADWGQQSLKYSNDSWSWTKKDETTKYFDSIRIIDKIDKDFIPKNASPSNLSSSKWRIEREKVIGINEKNYDQRGFDKPHIPLTLDPLIKFYNSKDCYYIQVSECGLYHLGKDKYELGTPKFDGIIDFRFRAKMHNNFSRSLKGPNSSKDGNKRSKGRKESKTKILSKFLFSGIAGVEVIREDNDSCVFSQNSDDFNPSIFEVLRNGQKLKINCYKEIFNLVDQITGKVEAEKGTHLMIKKYLDKNDPTIFNIKPTPWHYSFFGIMKLHTKPKKSPLSLDPNKSQSFPNINAKD